jgi:hypothetical protein
LLVAIAPEDVDAAMTRLAAAGVSAALVGAAESRSAKAVSVS